MLRWRERRGFMLCRRCEVAASTVVVIFLLFLCGVCTCDHRCSLLKCARLSLPYPTVYGLLRLGNKFDAIITLLINNNERREGLSGKMITAGNLRLKKTHYLVSKTNINTCVLWRSAIWTQPFWYCSGKVICLHQIIHSFTYLCIYHILNHPCRYVRSYSSE